MFKRLGLVMAASLVFTIAAGTQGRKTLDIYFIDTEGGQATLYLSPSGESLLVDAGNPGERDARRIAETAKAVGLQEIDYLLVTHYDGDHVGGVADLAPLIPIRTFIDHGAWAPVPGAPSLTPEAQANSDRSRKRYEDVRPKGDRHIEAKPGDRIPIKGIDVQLLGVNGAVITRPLAVPGAGADNPLCRDFTVHPEDTSDNHNSLGLVIGAFGRFRMLNDGDMPWNIEKRLVCPRNLLGTVDLYLATHHGLAKSGPPQLVHAVRPKVAVDNNSARKGHSRETANILKSSPGLQDMWQLHYAAKRPPLPRYDEVVDPGGPDGNAPEQFIANMVEEPPAHAPAYLIKVSVQPGGRFTVTNTRNGFSKEYTATSRY
jgi:competence protein ComEC